MSDNDFKLEELEELEIIYGRHCDEQYNQGNLVKSEELLLVKLRELIKNYCDHDFYNTYNEREVWECSKCGVE